MHINYARAQSYYHSWFPPSILSSDQSWNNEYYSVYIRRVVDIKYVANIIERTASGFATSTSRVCTLRNQIHRIFREQRKYRTCRSRKENVGSAVSTCFVGENRINKEISQGKTEGDTEGSRPYRSCLLPSRSFRVSISLADSNKALKAQHLKLAFVLERRVDTFTSRRNSIYITVVWRAIEYTGRMLPPGWICAIVYATYAVLWHTRTSKLQTHLRTRAQSSTQLPLQVLVWLAVSWVCRSIRTCHAIGCTLDSNQWKAASFHRFNCRLQAIAFVPLQNSNHCNRASQFKSPLYVASIRLIPCARTNYF